MWVTKRWWENTILYIKLIICLKVINLNLNFSEAIIACKYFITFCFIKLMC